VPSLEADRVRAFGGSASMAGVGNERSAAQFTVCRRSGSVSTSGASDRPNSSPDRYVVFVRRLRSARGTASVRRGPAFGRVVAGASWPALRPAPVPSSPALREPTCGS